MTASEPYELFDSEPDEMVGFLDWLAGSSPPRNGKRQPEERSAHYDPAVCWSWTWSTSRGS